MPYRLGVRVWRDGVLADRFGLDGWSKARAGPRISRALALYAAGDPGHDWRAEGVGRGFRFAAEIKREDNVDVSS